MRGPGAESAREELRRHYDAAKGLARACRTPRTPAAVGRWVVGGGRRVVARWEVSEVGRWAVGGGRRAVGVGR